MKRYLAILILIFSIITSCEELIRKTGIATGEAIEVGYQNAKVSGTITDLSEQPHMQHGFCYAKQPNPTLDDAYVDLGSGSSVGDFTAELTGLEPNTEYYFKAFIKDGDDFILDQAQKFTTLTAPLPSLSLNAPSTVTINSVILTGNIVSGNGDSITQSGLCFGLNAAPTASDEVSLNSLSVRHFTDTLEKLQSSTTYYVRMFGTNKYGTGYSNSITFTTLKFDRPKLTTDSAFMVFDVQANLSGTITSQGEGTITEQGFCCSTNPNPTIKDKTVLATNSIGNFTATITGLSPVTQYNYRAYAKNDGGVEYGSVQSFQTKSPAYLATISLDVQAMNFALIRCYGSISDDGGGVTEVGLAWSQLNYKPTIDDNYRLVDTIILFGNNRPEFRLFMRDLTPNTRYNFRAVAKNSAGVAYSDNVVFTTPQDMPEVATVSALQVMTTKALIVSQEVPTFSNVSGITYGVCWNTTGNPDLSGQNMASNVFSMRYFETPLTGLTANTTYYVKAYATYKGETAYGSEISFTTLNPSDVITDYDGNEYTTVTIGSQVWMQQNLKARHYSDGTPLSEYTIYGNKPELAEIYGLLYKQNVAERNIHIENTQGVCPDGWNIPSVSDWNTLIDYVGTHGTGLPGTQLADKGDVHWHYYNIGTNSSGFTAFGAGMYTNGAVSIELGKGCSFLTSANYQTFGMEAGYGDIRIGSSNENSAVSLRCIKNKK